MEYPRRLVLTACLLAATATPVSGSEDIHEQGNYERCNVDYHMRLQPGDHVDQGPFRHQFSACVNDLGDCRRRAESLAKAHARRADIPGEGSEPNLDSIMVGSVNIDGTCDRLD